MTRILIPGANGQLARHTTRLFLDHTDANLTLKYRITQKGEAFLGHDLSLNSLSNLIVTLARSPSLHLRCSLGVSN